MIRLKFLALLLVTAGLLSHSCRDPKVIDSMEEARTMDVDGLYTIDIPPNMEPTTGLNAEASLQYRDIQREAYTLVIHESKEKLLQLIGSDRDRPILEVYREIRLQLLAGTTQIQDRAPIREHSLNGLRAESLEVDALVEGIDGEISYFLTFVEGPVNVFLIMS